MHVVGYASIETVPRIAGLVMRDQAGGIESRHLRRHKLERILPTSIASVFKESPSTRDVSR